MLLLCSTSYISSSSCYVAAGMTTGCSLWSCRDQMWVNYMVGWGFWPPLLNKVNYNHEMFLNCPNYLHNWCGPEHTVVISQELVCWHEMEMCISISAQNVGHIMGQMMKQVVQAMVIVDQPVVFVMRMCWYGFTSHPWTFILFFWSSLTILWSVQGDILLKLGHSSHPRAPPFIHTVTLLLQHTHQGLSRLRTGLWGWLRTAVSMIARSQANGLVLPCLTEI